MSNISAILTIGVLGVGISVGGVYMSGMLSYDSKLPDTFEAFKQSKGGGCAKALFGGMENMDGTSKSEIASTDQLFTDSSSAYQGCLVVNWDKYTSTDSAKSDKGNGNFRFLWAMAKGNEGFAVFSIAETKNESSKPKLSGQGIAYKLKKDNGKGAIEKQKTLSAKEIEKSNANTKFPTPGTSLEGVESTSTFWGWMESDASMDKIDTSIEKTNSVTSFRGYWSWENSSDTSASTADSWSSKLGDGWNETYTKTELDIKTKVANVKGKWINKDINSPSK